MIFQKYHIHLLEINFQVSITESKTLITIIKFIFLILKKKILSIAKSQELQFDKGSHKQ